MPICPRCGKSFSSEQALCYHLNKKYKCGTWKCAKCQTVFDTKFALKIHTMQCEEYSIDNTPSYDVLSTIYRKSPNVYIECDNNGVIHSISPSVQHMYGYSQGELVGKKTTEYMETIGNKIFRKTKTGELVQIEQEQIDVNLWSERIFRNVAYE